MTKQYIIKRFFPGETETETPYYMTVGRGWGYTSNIADATFFKNPENAFVKLNKIRERVDGEYGIVVFMVEFKETPVELKVKPF